MVLIDYNTQLFYQVHGWSEDQQNGRTLLAEPNVQISESGNLRVNISSGVH